MTDLVLLEKKDQIGWITMNRPEALNALDENMKRALIDAFNEVEYDDDIRAVVLRGAGKHFQAGGDLVSFHQDRQTMDDAAYRFRFHAAINYTKLLLTSIWRMPKPIIASVQGQAVGFGLSLAVMCDFTIAAEDAKFTLAYVRIGNSPDGASSYYLPRLLGLKKATELAMLGEQLTAHDAKQHGLVSFLAPPEKLAEVTETLAKRLATGPTRAYGNIKKLMHASLENNWERQLQMEAECFVDNVTSNDFNEGLTAFVERRPTRFTGR